MSPENWHRRAAAADVLLGPPPPPCDANFQVTSQLKLGFSNSGAISDDPILQMTSSLLMTLATLTLLTPSLCALQGLEQRRYYYRGNFALEVETTKFGPNLSKHA